MRSDPISPNSTEPYGDCDVGVDDWQLLATCRTRTVVEAQASSAESCPAINHVHCPAVASNSALAIPCPRTGWAGPLSLGNPRGLSTSGRSPTLHAEHYYHIVGYDAREKFRAAVAYVILGVTARAEGVITHVFSAVCFAEGLHQLASKLGPKKGLPREARHRLDPQALRQDSSRPGRSLAHNAVRRLAKPVISPAISEGRERSRSWEPRIIFM